MGVHPATPSPDPTPKEGGAIAIRGRALCAQAVCGRPRIWTATKNPSPKGERSRLVVAVKPLGLDRLVSVGCHPDCKFASNPLRRVGIRAKLP